MGIRTLYYTVIYSPDDAGYYAEVFTKSGKNVLDTPVFGTIRETMEHVRDKCIGKRLIRLGPVKGVA